MDSDSAVSSVLISESKENGADSLPHSEPPAAAAGEDGFETALEDSGVAKKATVVEKGENPSPDGKIEEEVEIYGGESNQEGLDSDGKNEQEEVLDSATGAEAEPKVESLVTAAEIRDENSSAESKAIEIEEKDEGLDDNGKSELEEKEKVEDSRPETEQGSVVAEGEKEEEKEKVEDSKPETEQSSVVAEGEKEEEKEKVEDSKPETEQSSVVAEGEKEEVCSVVTEGEKEEEPKPEMDQNDAAEKEVSVELVGSDQTLKEAVEMKRVGVEPNADDTEKVDVLVKSKDVEEEGANQVVDEKQTENAIDVSVEEEGANAAVDEKQTENAIDVSVDSKPVADETSAVKTEDNGVADSFEEAVKSKATEEESDAAVVEVKAVSDSLNANQNLDEAANLKVVEKDATFAGETGKTEQETEGEKALTSSEQVLTDLEAKPSNDGEDLNPSRDLETVPFLSDDSESKKAETEPFEKSGVVENGTTREISVEKMLLGSVTAEKLEPAADSSRAADDENHVPIEAEEEEKDANSSDQHPRVAILESSETAKQIIKEMNEGSSSTSFESSSYQRPVEGQIVSDSDEEVDTDDDGDDKELFDTAALAALLKAATGASSDGSTTVTSQDGTRVFSVDRPAGLGSSVSALRPAPSRTRPNLFSPSELAVTAEPESEMDEEERKLHEKIEDIRVKFLRLVMRLGHTPDDTVAAQVLYRLSLAEGLRRGRQMSRAFSIETAKKKAIQLEADGGQDLKFSCNILVLGKTGVGKSATINSIFGEEKSTTNAFQVATTSVKEISGVVDGVTIRVIDTPGLRSSVMEQTTNRKILSSIKKYTKKCPPDIILYVDRLDTQTRDFNDLPLLRSITSALGSSIWFNAIVALTHAASAPPDGPHGSPLSYEVFVAQRSHVVQHSIRQAAGDMRLMNPVALVENHPSCRRNREGERVLPNGLSWRPQLLLLCYSSKILSEANSLLKIQDPLSGKLFGFRSRSPPLPYLLSTLLQSRPHPKLPSDQGGDNADSDIDLDDFSDADEEEEDEYDQLPPFKPLKKSQIAKLTKEQKRAYWDEYDYRFRLLQKKQFKDEVRRLREMKKRGKSAKDDSPYGDMGEDFDQDGAPAAVPVPLPDMVLPPSFDCDVPTYRYRFLEPTSQLLTRPVLDNHSWDHDCGYDGVSIEESLALANRFPAAIAVQITKDKKDFSIHLDSSIAAKHGENGSSLAGFDIQSVGKQLAYILRGETKFKNFKKNKTAAGVSVTFLGETVATGLKLEDQLTIGKRVGLVASTGAVRAQGDVAYGANLEARLREKDYPIGQALSTLGLSLMKWRGDLALGANLQSQVNVGRNSKVAVRVGLNNKLSGQITVRTSTSEHLQIALVGIIPVAVSVFRNIWLGEDMAH